MRITWVGGWLNWWLLSSVVANGILYSLERNKWNAIVAAVNLVLLFVQPPVRKG